MIFVHFFMAVVLFKALGEAATRPGIPTSAAVMLAITSAASGFAAQFLVDAQALRQGQADQRRRNFVVDD